jgi:cell division protein FtsL
VVEHTTQGFELPPDPDEVAALRAERQMEEEAAEEEWRRQQEEEQAQVGPCTLQIARVAVTELVVQHH